MHLAYLLVWTIIFVNFILSKNYDENVVLTTSGLISLFKEDNYAVYKYFLWLIKSNQSLFLCRTSRARGWVTGTFPVFRNWKTILLALSFFDRSFDFRSVPQSAQPEINTSCFYCCLLQNKYDYLFSRMNLSSSEKQKQGWESPVIFLDDSLFKFLFCYEWW